MTLTIGSASLSRWSHSLPASNSSDSPAKATVAVTRSDTPNSAVGATSAYSSDLELSTVAMAARLRSGWGRSSTPKPPQSLGRNAAKKGRAAKKKYLKEQTKPSATPSPHNTARATPVNKPGPLHDLTAPIESAGKAVGHAAAGAAKGVAHALTSDAVREAATAVGVGLVALATVVRACW